MVTKNSDKPLISIIITCYNYEKYIEESIVSALNQTYSNIEVIVINDGSTDKSIDIIKKYKNKLLIVDRKNKGIIYSRNEGISKSNGTFFAFLDADDYFQSDYIEQMYDCLFRSDADIVYSDMFLFGDENERLSMPNFDLGLLITHNYINISSLVRKKSVETIEFDQNLNELSHEDWDFYLNAALSGCKIIKNNNRDVFLNYRIHNNVTSRNLDIKINKIKYQGMINYIYKKYINLYDDFLIKYIDYVLSINKTNDEHKELRPKYEKLLNENYELIKEIKVLRDDNIKLTKDIDCIYSSRKFKLAKILASPVTIVKSIKHNGFKKTTIKILKKTVLKNDRIRKIIKRNLYRDNYSGYVRQIYPSKEQIDYMKSVRFKYEPKISVIIPTYNTPARLLNEAINSVRSQTYQNWELILIDDASPDANVRKIINKFSAMDNRIIKKFLDKNKHIAGATNEGIKLATGEYISLFDHDDLLWPNALFEIVKAIDANNNVNFIYTDEDKVSLNSKNHFDPFFKPDWNPDFLRSVNYITHFTTIRKEILDNFGYESSKFDGAQDWELFLRITRSINRDTICHIPKVLYSWRAHPMSTAESGEAKPYVYEAQLAALNEDVSMRGYKNAKIKKNSMGYFEVDYGLVYDPLISIIIPTKNQYSVVKRCIESIYEKSDYDNFEIILVDTGSDDKKVIDWYEEIKNKHANITITEFIEDKFSYSKTCNFGARTAKGELLLQLNNDTEVKSSNWLRYMASYAMRPEIGAVGPKLFFPNNKLIQHAGVGIGVGAKGASAVNLFTHFDIETPKTYTQSLMLNLIHDQTAVTAACLMIRKEIFWLIGGFDDELRVTFNDVDLCLKIWEAGYYNVFLPNIELIHHESISVGVPHKNNRDMIELLAADLLFKKRWDKYIKNDPNYNSCLDKTKADYSL